MTTTLDSPPSSESTVPSETSNPLEKKGRRWLIWSFLLCPCHLPVTLALLAVVLGGTAIGTLVADNAVLAGAIVTTVWLYGTARGLRYIRKADRGELVCEVGGGRTIRSVIWP